MEALSVILVVVEGTSTIQNVCVCVIYDNLVFYDMALFYGFYFATTAWTLVLGEET